MSAEANKGGRPRVFGARGRGVFYARPDQLATLTRHAANEKMSVSDFIVAILVYAGVMEP